MDRAGIIAPAVANGHRCWEACETLTADVSSADIRSSYLVKSLCLRNPVSQGHRLRIHSGGGEPSIEFFRPRHFLRATGEQELGNNGEGLERGLMQERDKIPVKRTVGPRRIVSAGKVIVKANGQRIHAGRGKSKSTPCKLPFSTMYRTCTKSLLILLSFHDAIRQLGSSSRTGQSN
jgi:hypothetical protein